MIDVENCRITHYPTPVLSQKAENITTIDDNIRRLVAKMAEIMFQNTGIGLAGPQVGLPLRIFIVCLDGNKENIRVYINPTVTPSGELDVTEEGCLSVPGIHAKIRRYKTCTVTATDLDGNEFTDEAEGLYARCLQHEYDHIEGITIVDKIGSAAKIAHRKTLKKLKEKYDKP